MCCTTPGMGTSSIGRTVTELRAVLGREHIPLMIINNHNHLDHNGGNTDFSEAWIIRDGWSIRKLTQGLSGVCRILVGSDAHERIEAPENFEPATFSIPPFPLQGIRYPADGDVVDLGDRQFRVIHTTSHSPDGLALYDETNKVFFGGDTFIGDMCLIRDLALLEQDLARVSTLQICWHYSSHGDQLLQAMQDGRRLAIVRRMLNGEREEGTMQFAGSEFPLYTVGDVQVAIAADFLTY
jgi:glyoxylase-like metal-dependent hydrolase (beta-lactamase superfamily II)